MKGIKAIFTALRRFEVGDNDAGRKMLEEL